jgi:hypothetical protein
VDRVAVVARLKEGCAERAAELVANGPPFDPADVGLDRHVVYISGEEIVFVFEGREVEWIVDDLVTTPFQWPLMAAFDAWRPLVDGSPRLARPAYAWSRA